MVHGQPQDSRTIQAIKTVQKIISTHLPKVSGLQ